MNDKDKRFKLYIPSNVKTRLEFFKGYGIHELILTIITVVALLPISIIVYNLNGNQFLVPVLIEFIGVAGMVIAVTKDKNNLCIINQLKYMIEFAGTQKKFKYKYYDKWRE
ncbi:MAG: hypothetical protein Q4G05_00265 [Clostridia bacterium]|nr:hypothetical protein [Clostridia bacterium]